MHFFLMPIKFVFDGYRLKPKPSYQILFGCLAIFLMSTMVNLCLSSFFPKASAKGSSSNCVAHRTQHNTTQHHTTARHTPARPTTAPHTTARHTPQQDERDRHRDRANQRSNTCNRPTTQTHLDNTYQMIRGYVLSSLAHIELLAFGILGV